MLTFKPRLLVEWLLPYYGFLCLYLLDKNVIACVFDLYFKMYENSILQA